VLENMGGEVVVCSGKRLGAAEIFWDDAGTRARGTTGLELRLAKRWNNQLSLY